MKKQTVSDNSKNIQPIKVEPVVKYTPENTIIVEGEKNPNDGYITGCQLEDENVKETKVIIEKIISFHKDVERYTNEYKNAGMNIVKSAIEVGKLLLQQKHYRQRTFMVWVECYLPFGYETAGRYMRLAKSSHVTKTDDNGNVIKLDEQKSLRQAFMMVDGVKPKPNTEPIDPKQKLVAFTYINKLMEVLPTYTREQKIEVLPYLEKLVEWVESTKEEISSIFDNHVETPMDIGNQKMVA